MLPVNTKQGRTLVINCVSSFLKERQLNFQRLVAEDLSPNRRKVRKDLAHINRLMRENSFSGNGQLRGFKHQKRVWLEELRLDKREMRWARKERGKINHILSLLGKAANGSLVSEAFAAAVKYLKCLQFNARQAKECSELIKEVERYLG